MCDILDLTYIQAWWMFQHQAMDYRIQYAAAAFEFTAQSPKYPDVCPCTYLSVAWIVLKMLFLSPIGIYIVI